MIKEQYEEMAEKFDKTRHSRVELLKIAKQMKPLCRVYNGLVRYEQNKDNTLGELYYISPVDTMIETFTWSPRPICKAPKLVKLAEVETLHRYAYPLMFKPSADEVFKFIPEEHRDKIVGFETFVDSDNVYDVTLKTSKGGFHRAITRFYGLADNESVPEEIQQQPVLCKGIKYPAEKIDSMQK